MNLLKQSTAATIKMGPFLDDTDGKTAETALTIAQADIKLSKNGGAFAQSNNAAGATHDTLGYYGVPLDATDTDTLGRLRVAVSESGALPVWEDFLVVTANVYDTFCSTGSFDVNVKAISGDTTAADNCELMFDGTGYAGGTTKLGVDAVAISGDATAADNLEKACDGTGYNVGNGSIVAASVTGNVGGSVASITAGVTLAVEETGTGLTAVPWNASWDAEVQSECADALTAYDAATATDVTTAHGITDGKIDAVDDYVDTEVAAIKAVTDKLDTAMELDVDVYRFTTNALEQAPTGSGATAEAIRQEIDANSTQLAAIVAVTDKLDTAMELDVDVYRFTTNALEQAPTGSGATAEAIRQEIDANSTQLAAIVADTNELQTNQGNWLTATGFSTHSAADVVTALGTGSTLTAVPWNASWDAEVQSECADALTAYDAATNAELTTALASADDAVLAAIAALTEAGVKKNTALSGFTFYMTDSTNHKKATGLTVTAERSLDGAAFAACANAVVELSDGCYKIDLADTDLNADVVALKFTAADADDLVITIRTSA